MSDPQYGEPGDKTPNDGDQTPVDDVVGQVNESLAEAEAASRDAVSAHEAEAAAQEVAAAPADAAPAAYDFSEHDHEPVDPDLAYLSPAATAAGTPDATTPDATAPHVAAAAEATAPTVATEAYAAPVAPAEPLTPSEPTVVAAPQPIFVQAPEAPRPRGNRGAAGLIGLVATAAFGVLYLAASLGFRAIDGGVTLANIGTEALAALTGWWFWVPVVVFFLAFWLLGAIINRGRWGQWVIFGLLVGAASYGGHLLGQLFQAPFWTLTASQGAELVRGQLLAPAAIAALIIGREITIWFGAWVAARGARMTELNIEAQREYERTLEAGPQLQR